VLVITVSLVTAVLFGSGDFLGGLAAKRVSVTQVVLGSHVVGLIGIAGAALVVAEQFRLADLVLGAAGGFFGGVGVALLYRRLAVGPMHVVAPLTAITSAVVPTAWGVGIGDELTAVAWAGIGLGLVAIGLVSGSKPSGETTRVDRIVVSESLLAGCGFGAFFIFLDTTDASSAPWPIVGARLCTTFGLLIVLTLLRRPVVASGAVAWALIAGAGAFDVAANAGFLYATTRGALAVVSVLTSLYPVATVVLARIVLGERMTRYQGAGFVGALGATVLIGAG